MLGVLLHTYCPTLRRRVLRHQRCVHLSFSELHLTGRPHRPVGPVLRAHSLGSTGYEYLPPNVRRLPYRELVPVSLFVHNFSFSQFRFL